MHAGDDAHEPRGGDEVDAVGKPAKEGSSRLAADDGVALGHGGDVGERGIGGAHELSAEPWGTSFVPERGLEDVGLGRVADDETHASAGRAQAAIDATAHGFPGLAGLGVPGQGGEAAIELGGLRLGQRELAGLGRDAVPEVLSELDALGHGELADVETGGGHELSVPRVGAGCKTWAVDIRS